MAIIFFYFSSYGSYFFRFFYPIAIIFLLFILWQIFFHFYEEIRSTDNMKWVNRRKLVLMWKIIFMEECASIIHVTSDKKKAGLLLWFVNLFWSIFSFSSQTFCFFWRPSAFLGFFGLRKAWRPFSGQKIPKRPQASRKNKMSSSFSWKYSKKSWLIMKKCLLSFYLWSHIILTRILPWYYT